jgi:uncharacterized protein (DUF934 family)
MDEDIRLFGEDLGKKALARDWAGVHALLAPWLQRTMDVDGVRAFFENEYQETLTANGVNELQYPEYPEPSVDGNAFTKATQLREPISWEGGRVRDVDPAVTDDNVRCWMKLQLQASDEQMEKLGFDTFAEVWVAVVTTDQGLRVGYWSQGAY